MTQSDGNHLSHGGHCFSEKCNDLVMFVNSVGTETGGKGSIVCIHTLIGLGIHPE